jgi:hypothetical protein
VKNPEIIECGREKVIPVFGGIDPVAGCGEYYSICLWVILAL